MARNSRTISSASRSASGTDRTSQDVGCRGPPMDNRPGQLTDGGLGSGCATSHIAFPDIICSSVPFSVLETLFVSPTLDVLANAPPRSIGRSPYLPYGPRA